MNFLFKVATTLLVTGCAYAQNVSYDAVKFAETWVNSSWEEGMGKAWPSISLQMETQFKENGVSDQATKIWMEEFRRSFTKENFSRALAPALTEKFSPDELKELSTFIGSNLGKKYLQLNSTLSTDPRFIALFLKQTCDATKSRLALNSRGNIDRVCGNF